jgi:phosphatidylserine/phosphatidylglycerophosphate/cardiolipin synthase-like enzyme
MAFFCGQSRVEVFFSPQDRPSKKLIATLDNAKHRIFVAMYTFTEKSICDALVRARQRNVEVRMVLDKMSFESPWGKAEQVCNAGGKIFLRSSQLPQLPKSELEKVRGRETTELEEVLQAKDDVALVKGDEEQEATQSSVVEELYELEPGPAEFTPPLHKKNWGFGREPLMHNKYAIIDHQVWTGSFNWTVSADTKNQENVVLISGEQEVVQKFLHNFEALVAASTLLDKKTIVSMRQEPPKPYSRSLKGSRKNKILPPPAGCLAGGSTTLSAALSSSTPPAKA